MTPKEKALNLYLLFRIEIEYLDGTEAHKNMRSKQCALIAVDEIINALENYDNNTESSLKESQGIEYFSCELQNIDSDFRYWDKVKQEIKNL